MFGLIQGFVDAHSIVVKTRICFFFLFLFFRCMTCIIFSITVLTPSFWFAAFWSVLLWDVLWLLVVSQLRPCWQSAGNTFTLVVFFHLVSPSCSGCTLHPPCSEVLPLSSSLRYIYCFHSLICLLCYGSLKIFKTGYGIAL